MKAVNILPLLLLLVCMTPSCAFLSGKNVRSGPPESRYDDASIKTAISSALLRADAGKANDVNVHCFRGHVFLVGETDKAFAAQALEVASGSEGVVHVTTHWFAQGTADTVVDAAIEEEIEKRLLFSGDISTRRIDIDVWGGNVVLTGLAKSQQEIQSAVAAIKRMQTVKSVTSYLAPE